jgi:hypothetical protein
VTFSVAVALGPPFRIMVWPVNTLVVEVPPELVSVTCAPTGGRQLISETMSDD